MFNWGSKDNKEGKNSKNAESDGPPEQVVYQGGGGHVPNAGLDEGSVLLGQYGGGRNFGTGGGGSVTGAKTLEEKRARKKYFKQIAAAASAAAGHNLVLPKPQKPGHIVCLYFFHFFSGIAILASLALLLTQLIPFFVVSHSVYIAEFGYETFALKIYNSLFFILFILTEWDLQIPFIQSSQILQGFMTRGFIYSFFGLGAIDESRSAEMNKVLEIAGLEVDENGDNVVDETDGIVVFMIASSYGMLLVGIIYMLFGACFLQRLRDGMKEREKEAWADYRELLAEWRELHR